MSRNPPTPQAIDASRFRVAIAAASYNEGLVDTLLARVKAALAGAGLRSRNLTVVRVPGSNELALAARLLVDRLRPDAVVALGVIIRGATTHYELISAAATSGLQDVALATGVPVINGIVVAENAAQARARCGGRLDRGSEFAGAAVWMAALRRRLAR
jgi:6,7-dimethyl-8-ribityllumazine synthase